MSPPLRSVSVRFSSGSQPLLANRSLSSYVLFTNSFTQWKPISIEFNTIFLFSFSIFMQIFSSHCIAFQSHDSTGLAVIRDMVKVRNHLPEHMIQSHLYNCNWCGPEFLWLAVEEFAVIENFSNYFIEKMLNKVWNLSVFDNFHQIQPICQLQVCCLVPMQNW